ncbi:MAG: ROK family protein [Fimbriimonas sp.]
MEQAQKDVEDLEAPPATTRPGTLKRINMRRFLDELRRRGPSTRADLTRAIGVTPPTSSNIIADLLETGLLEESDAETLSVAKGRPGKIFRLASTSAFVVAMTIGISECVVAPSGLDGAPRYEQVVRFSTPAGYDDLVRSIVEAVQSLREANAGRCLGLGIAVPGLVDERLGRVAFSPNLHFLDGHDLGPDLAARLDLDVVCTQEEHALCLAEQSLGQAQGLTDFAVVDFSSGVGMGVVSGGRYISGRRGFAGEIGHTTVQPAGLPCGCGNRGCLETVASDVVFLRTVRARLREEIEFDEVQRRVTAGSLDVSQELAHTLDFVSIGLATVVNLFNPEAIFLHGRMFVLNDEVLPALHERVRDRALRPSTETVEFRIARGDKLYGAVTGLLDHVFASVGPTLG